MKHCILFFLFEIRIGQIGRGSFSESSMLEHLWSKVTIEPLTKTELKEVGIKGISWAASSCTRVVARLSKSVKNHESLASCSVIGVKCSRKPFRYYFIK